ncbi:hypothetical protein N5C70_13525 [Pseudomonas juntendi]|uniref:Uncharacterized protein n=1 Tax=Pseudomonas juntendi TaxID=2666183 RepID=A0ABD4YEK4_9PSED|nr:MULTISPECIES: hypothetical protein [Pseudomonas]MDH0757718.1 hypothetical protein [Pseudomonas juntendi]MDH1920656.1 hypothetical protein [Pseudomonas juntendi]
MSEHEAYSQQIEKLNPKQGDLLVISIPQILTQEQRVNAHAVMKAQAKRLGFQALVVDGGITAQLQPSVADLLAEQQKQTALLEQIATQNLALIEALADDQGVEPDAAPQVYLSGAPVIGAR